jgi:mono/diheme cytochrome c family protein
MRVLYLKELRFGWRGLVRALGALALAALPIPAAPEAPRAFLEQYCQACHQGESPAAGFRTQDHETIESFRTRPNEWTKLTARVANSEMPPPGVAAPPIEEREAFLRWAEATWRDQACAADVPPAHSLLRRLNRDEYAATIRDLFDLQLDVSEQFPVDGPGGEGFDNAAETLFLSPLHSEKYLEVAKFILDAAGKEFKSRQKIFVARPGAGATEAEAAEKILQEFLPRAFRRPVDQPTVDSYITQFNSAREQGQDFEPAILFALRSALLSPRFLFHVEPAEGDVATRQYAIASRLSYFLWGGMPDELLFDAAAAGRLDDPEVLKKLIPRMLRNPRSLTFAERFVEQWLRTRELKGEKAPDAELFPNYYTDEELRSDIQLQPVFFFREVFKDNLPLTTFLESNETILTQTLVKHFGMEKIEEANTKDPRWVELPGGSNRGGLLGMPAVLAVSSHPYRTSPVLRGAWILDSILGAPPSPPPPDVPPLEENASGAAPKSVRERLEQHRANAVCASCHDRIDPLGFALENYDVLGAWRDADGGKPVDATGKLADGTPVDGPGGLKRALLARNEDFLRNLAKRMLGYALGRGLTPADACTVETIVDRVQEADASAWTLIQEIAVSDPFRFTSKAQEAQP